MAKTSKISTACVSACIGIVMIFAAVSVVSHLALAMGTPPFDADLRSSIGAGMRSALDVKGCLAAEETIEVTSKYRKLKPREPIPNKTLTLTVSFAGRDSKGPRAITVFYTATTNTDGEVNFSVPMSQALADANQALQSDRFYRGVKRVRGRVGLSLSTEDTFKRSIRAVPARGFRFRLCRVS